MEPILVTVSNLFTLHIGVNAQCCQFNGKCHFYILQQITINLAHNIINSKNDYGKKKFQFVLQCLLVWTLDQYK